MQTKNPFLDDLSRLASGALGTLTEMRSEIESRVRDQLERVLSRMDLVSREEFDAVRALAAKARTEQESLVQRFDAVEERLRKIEAAGGKPRRAAPGSGGLGSGSAAPGAPVAGSPTAEEG